MRSVNELPFLPPIPNFQFHHGKILAKSYEKLGPLFRSVLPTGEQIVYMVGPEANRFVLSNHRLNFSHHQGWGKVFGVNKMFGDGLLTMDNEENAIHRRIVNPAFSLNYMERYLPVMLRVIQERAAGWLNNEVDIYNELRKVMFDVAAETLVGFKTGAEVDHFREIFEQILSLRLTLEDQSQYEPTLLKLRQELYDLLTPLIEERRRNATDDALSFLVHGVDATGNPLSVAQLIAHTNILLLAGHDTSTSLCAWLLYLLVSHPEYLHKVQDEQSLLAHSLDDLNLDTIKRMKVLDYALSEAERMYPPIANGPRGVLDDFVFHDCLIPKGTLVLYSILASHFIPTIFTDPETFDPDRFAPPREEDKKTPYSLVGFGGGPRICIGVNFARIEIKLIVSYLLNNYRLDLLPKQDIVQFYRGTGIPLNGIKIQLTKTVS